MFVYQSGIISTGMQRIGVNDTKVLAKYSGKIAIAKNDNTIKNVKIPPASEKNLAFLSIFIRSDSNFLAIGIISSENILYAFFLNSDAYVIT